MRRPRASAGVYPKSRSAPGFQPTTVPARSMVTIATGLVSTSASEYCFWRWISRKSPALWMASTDWVAKVWSVATTSGEKAPRSRRRMTRPPSSRPSRTSGTARSERMPSRVRSSRTWGATSCRSACDVGDLDGLPAHPGPTHGALAEPDRRWPAAPSRCSGVIWCVARAWKLCVASSNS